MLMVDELKVYYGPVIMKDVIKLDRDAHCWHQGGNHFLLYNRFGNVRSRDRFFQIRWSLYFVDPRDLPSCMALFLFFTYDAAKSLFLFFTYDAAKSLFLFFTYNAAKSLFLFFTYDAAKSLLCVTFLSPHAHRFVYLTVLDFWHQFCMQRCMALHISYIVAHIEAGCKWVPISYFFSLWKPRNERNYASNKKSRLKGKRSAALLKWPTVMKELRPLFSPLCSERLACASVHAAVWSMFTSLCVCACACMCMRVVYLGNLVGFHCAFGPVYVLLTLMFFYCAARAHVRLYGKYTFTSRYNTYH